MELRTSDFHYDLPEELIASKPCERRDGSRLLVIDRATRTWEHRQFRDFPEFLQADDLLVLNNTRVLKARVITDDGQCELVCIERPEPNLWRCLVRPGKKFKIGRECQVAGLTGRVEAIDEDGNRLIRFERVLDPESVGQYALPHYMGRACEAIDDERYQTVYAQEAGAIAAPTAGLHFTEEMLAQLPHEYVTLHVGVGTFRPVKVEKLAEHHMHSERYQIREAAAQRISGAKRRIAVGTTVMRVLESVAAKHGSIRSDEGSTDIFIYPPYDFKAVDALLTNFHLPQSTLLMLVSAFADRELMLAAYAAAVQERYRFFSYGDCMLIL